MVLLITGTSRKGKMGASQNDTFLRKEHVCWMLAAAMDARKAAFSGAHSELGKLAKDTQHLLPAFATKGTLEVGSVQAED